MSIILTVFVILTFGMLDLGMGVYRYHIISNAARQGARQAIVHGANSTTLGVWGPTTIGPVAANSSGVAIVDSTGDSDNRAGLKPLLYGCDLSQTNIKVEWIDGSNAVGKRVRCTVTSPYTPFMPFLSSVSLSAASTMPIAH
jgi:Flp pilus assembly protein TadG